MGTVRLSIIVMMVLAGPATAAPPTALTGLNISTMSVQVTTNTGYDATLEQHVLTLLAQGGFPSGNPAHPSAALIIDLTWGCLDKPACTQVVWNPSTKVYEDATGPHGNPFRGVVWSMVQPSNVAPKPTDAQLRNEVAIAITALLASFREANGIQPSGPSLSLSGNGGSAYTLNVQNAPNGPGDCITVDKTDWSNRNYFKWVKDFGSTLSAPVALSSGVWQLHYWKACGGLVPWLPAYLTSSATVTVQ